MIIMMNYFPVTVIWRRQKLVKQKNKESDAGARIQLRLNKPNKKDYFIFN
jgi:hypothetical protein